MTEAEAGVLARTVALAREGAASLAARWDDAASMVTYAEHAGFHDPRGTLAYAAVLLREPSGEDVARAEAAINAVIALQERRDNHARRGNFRWMLEDEGVTDLNAVEFMLDGLIAILRNYADRLSAATLDEMRAAVALGLGEIQELGVHPSYTNIALSDICNSILGGELLQLDEAVERGAARLDEWFEYTNNSGAPHEYNSPTYLAVDIARMALLAEHTSDQDIALKARIAEERLWLHVASHYHPGLAQLAGPHSRSYFDGWTGAGGYLKLLLWRELGGDALRRTSPYAARSREEGHTGIASEDVHVPACVERLLRAKTYPYRCHEIADAERDADLTTYMTANYALGTASRSYAVGEPPEPWPQANGVLLQFRREAEPGFGTLFARYSVDDHGLGAHRHDSVRTAEDWWDEGTFVAAQHEGRAIVAYGLVPRMRPARSYKLSVNMLGVAGAAVRVGAAGRAPAGGEVATVAAGASVCVAAGDVYVAIIPLEPSDLGSDAPIELRVEGEQLTLDIYNYRGPAKTFWEHRSQAGPFFKGNVRNAFVLEVAAKEDFADIDAFVAHIAAGTLADGVDQEATREIAYRSGGASLALRYSLLDMSPAGRRIDGAPYVPPMGRSGSPGGGPQFAQSRETLLHVGGASLMAGSTPKWLIADDDEREYVFVNPSTEEAPVWFETPGTVVECDGFGFGRIEIDDRRGRVTIDACGEIGPVRIRRADEATLTVNDIDVSDMLLRTTEEGVREFRGL